MSSPLSDPIQYAPVTRPHRHWLAWSLALLLHLVVIGVVASRQFAPAPSAAPTSVDVVLVSRPAEAPVEAEAIAEADQRAAGTPEAQAPAEARAAPRRRCPSARPPSPRWIRPRRPPPAGPGARHRARSRGAGRRGHPGGAVDPRAPRECSPVRRGLGAAHRRGALGLGARPARPGHRQHPRPGALGRVRWRAAGRGAPRRPAGRRGALHRRLDPPGRGLRQPRAPGAARARRPAAHPSGDRPRRSGSPGRGDTILGTCRTRPGGPGHGARCRPLPALRPGHGAPGQPVHHPGLAVRPRQSLRRALGPPGSPMQSVQHFGLKHHFLLAMPHLEDPNFAGSLSYLCDHDENGTMGVIVNRPLELTLDALFEQLELGARRVPIARRRSTTAARPTRIAASSCIAATATPGTPASRSPRTSP